MRYAASCLLALGALALCAGATAEEAKDPERLARDRGCLVCHDVAGTPPNAQAILPLAPAFRDVARRYRADPQAAARLAALVRQGTSPAKRHWEGKAYGDRMFPNDLEVTDEEARAIVDWILSLDRAAPARAGASPPTAGH